MAETESFSLVTDEYTLTTGALAERVGVTTQTVRNHAAKLGSAHAKRGTDGAWVFKPSAVHAWRHTVPAARKGGKRRGAGRKPIAGEKPLTKTATDIQQARADVRERMTPDENGELPAVDPAKLMRLSDVLRCTKPELAVLVSVGGPADHLLGDAQVRRLAELQELQTKQLRLEKEKGTLVPVEQVADAWEREQRRVREQVQTLPKRVGPRVEAACWVGDEQVAAICRMLKEHGVEGSVITQVADMLVRPADLAGRVQGMMNDEIQAVMREMSAPPKTNSEA